MSAINVEKKGLGWLKDKPDTRDLTVEAPELTKLLRKGGVAPEQEEEKLPASADLREHFGPVQDQGRLNSCTAHCAAGLVAYFERRAFNADFEASRLFLYKVQRNLLQWQGDKGAYLRTAMAALVLVGAPKEPYWPYDPAKVDEEPGPFVYALAGNYKAVKYVRLDSSLDDPGPAELLQRIKRFLAAGFPIVFGLPMYAGVRAQSATTGCLPVPAADDIKVGGHAMTAVGYDDAKVIQNSEAGQTATTGAILVRNSWGPNWGPDKGYGWVPYEYVTQSLASDWWSLLSQQWIDAGEFGL